MIEDGESHRQDGLDALPTPAFQSDQPLPGDLCHHCGQRRHIYTYDCPFNLHGETDPFKTVCAICETPIPSGTPRQTDPFQNLYCSPQCASEGKSRLIEIATTDDLPVIASE
jgi:hypothetical protein